MKHLFRADTFARFAGTRTQAMIQSDFYAQLDEAHGGSISALDSRSTVPASVEPQTPQHPPDCHQSPAEPCDVPDFGHVDSDPSDEVMTGAGDTLTLFFALFVDGVQLHGHGRSTTTVIALKCLDLPGFLCNTDLACYSFAFISGPKEPSDLSEIMAIILQQFKCREPVMTDECDGECACLVYYTWTPWAVGGNTYSWTPCRKSYLLWYTNTCVGQSQEKMATSVPDFCICFRRHPR